MGRCEIGMSGVHEPGVVCLTHRSYQAVQSPLGFTTCWVIAQEFFVVRFRFSEPIFDVIDPSKVTCCFKGFGSVQKLAVGCQECLLCIVFLSKLEIYLP